ncbi:MAG TPA: hypothetical protein VM367_12225 [Pseudonocardia sp.]|nr:hypothetical protein [Pseudonocardia sp.]
MHGEWTAEERAAFRAFVREHHPDRGGDPAVFLAGMDRFRAGPRALPPGSSGAGGAGSPGRPDRFDAPVEIVTHGVPLRVLIRLVRLWRRHRRTRVR